MVAEAERQRARHSAVASIATALGVPRAKLEGRASRGPHAPPDPLLQEGIALFNHRQFFECHEVLEQRWRELTDSSKDFYKGLIQAAVAFYHWSQGNLPGALTLARSATNYLRRYEPIYAGVDVTGFLTQFTELFGWLRRHRQRYDPRLVPTMHLHTSST